MTRNSFIQMSKIHQVKGRIDYISNPDRQEHLYASYNTKTKEFWECLALESQQEFSKSGSKGTCIEARELIIALPEDFVYMDPQSLLKSYTDAFKNKHGVECISALHHNHTKKNYHIHLIFSERKLLDNPEIKYAARNMFINAEGKRVRTKKEIMENDRLMDGCSIIKKGSIYESHIFTAKDKRFKSNDFLNEVKNYYTNLINQSIEDPSKQLTVFDKNSVYLPQKKIGKNNPKEQEIKQDNQVRKEWNQTADMALIHGVPEEKILSIKKEKIQYEIKKSIDERGWIPKLFRKIVLKAKEFLTDLIFKHEYPKEPELTVNMQEFLEVSSIHFRLKQITEDVIDLEKNQLPELNHKHDSCKGFFKRKEREHLEHDIDDMKHKIVEYKNSLDEIVTSKGYPTVQAFNQMYYEMSGAVNEYKRAMEKWEHDIEQKKIQERIQKEKLRRQLRKIEQNKKVKSKSKGFER